MAARLGPTTIESQIRGVLAVCPFGTTARAIAIIVDRDPMSVYRCLLRMKKRGQVVSRPSPGKAYRHVWNLPE